ncbi:MAG: carboxy terminal-processing peptidase [Thermodesulfobacteriota bacterium]
MKIRNRVILKLLVGSLVCGVVAGSTLLFIACTEARSSIKPSAFPEDVAFLSERSTGILAPEEQHAKTSVEVVTYLQQGYFRDVDVNDAFASKVYDRYLTELDRMHLYFIGSDIKLFEPFRFQLDDALSEGDLQPAYLIFNRYQHRVLERIEFVLRQIDTELESMDFSIDERIEIEREKVPWPADEQEMNDLWRKRLKNEVLNLRLAGKPLEKIRSTLKKRYENQLTRIKQRNSEDVFRIYINAYTQSYDPHTQYFSPQLTENFNIMMRLSLEGIGAVLQNSDEYVKIVRLIAAGPADKSGLLKPGDRIVGVAQGLDGEMTDVVGWRLDDVVDLIRGPKETVVRLEVIPVDAVDEHQTKIVNITRNTVKLEDQAVKKKVMVMNGREGKTHRIGVIDIPTFYIDFEAYQNGKRDFRSTTRDVRRILEEFRKEAIDGVVIDLRDNGGGALQEANQLTGLFIESGPVVQVKDDRGRIRALNDPDPAVLYDGPLVVITNRISASASEIFAGAVQDYHRGIVVGSRTFGKGTVQTLENLKRGQLKLTHGMFYRISGASTQNRGIVPDIEFPSLYDQSKIGESALPEALPWASIPPVPYQPYPDLEERIRRLKKLHDDRIRADAGFGYLMAAVERLEEARSQTQVSLEEKKRLEERKKADVLRLELTNMRRKAEGLPLLKGTEELEAEEDEENEEIQEPEKEESFDPILTESGNVLADYILLSSESIAARW